MLKKLIVKNLYGMDYKISFREDLTIFYGRNGSGKTTILNIINYLMNGEIEKIVGYKFKYLRMEFYISSPHNFIEIIKEDSIYKINFMGEKIVMVENDNRVFISPDIKNLESSTYEDAHFGYYKQLIKSDNDDIKLFTVDKENNIKVSEIKNRLINKFDIVYLPLNRKVKFNKAKNTKKLGSHFMKSNIKNIEDSLVVAENYFINFKQHINYEESLKSNLIREKILDQISEPIKIIEISSLQEADLIILKKELENVFDEKIEKNIRELFRVYEDSKAKGKNKTESTKDLEQSFEQSLNHMLSLSQLIKIKKVFEITKKESVKLDKLKDIAKVVIKNINILFKETNKLIEFDERKNKLYFYNNTTKKPLDISLLSSGEKQLLIFFIFASIDYMNNASKRSLLLIDEPELSLHIEWQSKLLPLIMESGSSKQIVIATHSPDIIGDFIDNCVEIKGVTIGG